MDNLLNTIFPPKCIFCGHTAGMIFCRDCLEKCKTLESPIYFLPIKDLETQMKVFSPFEYEGKVRECIKYSKYGRKQFVALKILAELGVKFSQNLGLCYEKSYVVPIPLNIKKYRQRGFNQAELIANILAKSYGLSLKTDLLIRSKETTKQHDFSRKERFINMEGAFEITQSIATYKEIIIVDDICTSGATFISAYKAFREKGITSITGFSLSRKPFQKKPNVG